MAKITKPLSPAAGRTTAEAQQAALLSKRTVGTTSPALTGRNGQSGAAGSITGVKQSGGAKLSGGNI